MSAEPWPECALEGCHRPRTARNPQAPTSWLCKICRKRYLRATDPTWPECAVEGCHRPRITRNPWGSIGEFCETCRRRFRRNTDPVYREQWRAYHREHMRRNRERKRQLAELVGEVAS